MHARTLWCLALPAIAAMILLLGLPLLILVGLSATAASFGEAPRFVGLENYAVTLADQRFWRAVWWTAFYTGVSVVAQLVVATLLALGLDRIRAGRGALITAILAPFAVTPVAAALVFAWMLKDYWGPYSWLLEQVGVYVEWFSSDAGARGLLIVYKLWTSAPFAALVLFAAMQTMDRSPIEAAKIDGAGPLQRFFFVMAPMLFPVYSFVTIILLMDAWREFDSVFIMTEGGPGGATETVAYLAYQTAFVEQSLGRGAAISLLMTAAVAILLAPLLWRLFRDAFAPRVKEPSGAE